MVTSVTVSMSEFGRLLGLSRKTVAVYVALGMPAGPTARGAEGRRIPFAAARQWVEDRAVARARGAPDGGETKEQAELRKSRADADLAELKAAEMRGELVSREEVTQALAVVLRTLDAATAQMVARLVPAVAAEADAAAVRQLVLEATRRARAQMADDLGVPAATH